MTRVDGLGDPRAGFAFHDYCLPASSSGCFSEATAMTNAVRHVTRTREALLLTEFGSNPFPHDLTGMVRRADRQMVPWIEWAYCPCSDPTGATPDPLVLNPAQPPSGANLGQLALRALVEPYPHVLAGSPRSWGFDPATRTFRLSYRTARVNGRGPFGARSMTEIATPALVYPRGYAARASGAAIVSSQRAGVLVLAACPGAGTITVTVTASGSNRGSCRMSTQRRSSRRNFLRG